MANIHKITFLLLIILTLKSNSQNTATLILEVSGFKNDKGILHSHLFNDLNPDLFPTKSKQAFRQKSVEINTKLTKIVYENVPYGKYAVTTHQDYDKNNRLDKNFIGYPAEPFGLSNNPKILINIPKFDECAFEINKPIIIIQLKLKFV